MLVISDIHNLDRAAGPNTEVRVFSHQSCPRRWTRNFALLRAALKADYLVIHFSLAEVVFFATMFTLIPARRCRLVTLDFFVVRPGRWRLPVIRWSLRRIYKLLVYFRDSERIETLYSLPRGRFRYIPFKINQLGRILKAPISDDGSVFVGGRSRRDFATLLDAVKDLPCRVRILTAHEPDILPHGSSLAGLAIGPNVEIMYNDSDMAVFVESMAKARLVVIPIVRDCPVQAGISVYLMAMALRKCVIVSEAPGVTDVLQSHLACIVPPGDVPALRTAIDTLWNDASRRAAYAEAGHAYASKLGGEDRLRVSILQALGGNTRAIGDTEELNAS